MLTLKIIRMMLINYAKFYNAKLLLLGAET